MGFNFYHGERRDSRNARGSLHVHDDVVLDLGDAGRCPGGGVRAPIAL
jgi:hypothetical protein